ncbi:hypothetical protein EWM64_g10582 [Hericium alpestre]|uniref:Uncharacterized protein n=1 Tax=Hericium alpestre TaxID=135208 RepID=A0A4Y9ZGX6_9AGAM|nr:hypothetical protein EWM64_g10582 [Hericium alpestre]
MAETSTASKTFQSALTSAAEGSSSATITPKQRPPLQPPSQSHRAVSGSHVLQTASLKHADTASLQRLTPIDVSGFPEVFLDGPSGQAFQLLLRSPSSDQLSLYQQLIFMANKELPLDKIVVLKEDPGEDGPWFSLDANFRSGLHRLLRDAQPLVDAFLLCDISSESIRSYELDPKH